MADSKTMYLCIAWLKARIWVRLAVEAKASKPQGFGSAKYLEKLVLSSDGILGNLQ